MENLHNQHIASLYEEFQNQLHDDQLVMRDDILKTLIKIEGEVHAILDENAWEIWMDPRREKRYDLNSKGKNHFHTQVAKEAQIMENIVGRGQSVQHLLGSIARRQELVKNLLVHEDYTTMFSKLGIFFTHHTDGAVKPFIPTEWNRVPITGSGAGMEIKNQSEPKFLNFLSILRSIETEDGGNIDTRDIMVDVQSETPENMIRHLPYLIVRIPRLNRTVIINDRLGEATFVLQGLIDINTFQETTKSELESRLGAKKIVYNTLWWDNIYKYLTNNWSDTEENTEKAFNTLTTKNPIKPRVKMEMASLYSDTETIRNDLESFRVALGKESITELTTWWKSAEATLSNRQRVKWNTYLKNASNYLFGTKQGNKENGPRPWEALEELKISIGVKERLENELSEAYFRNKEFVRKDLESFRIAFGKESIAELSSSGRSTEAILSNGQRRKWQAYLNNASNYLLGTKIRMPKNWPALALLKKIANGEDVSGKIEAYKESIGDDSEQSEK